jgi:hypothetical protein
MCVAAGLALAVLSTPSDIVWQRLAARGAPGVPQYRGTAHAVRRILSADGVRGMYRGFVSTVLTGAATSAVWWGVYGVAQSALVPVHDSLPPSTATAVSGVLAGVLSAYATNPLDAAKTRIQVLALAGQATPPLTSVLRELALRGVRAGLLSGAGARAVQHIPWSIALAVGYQWGQR